MSSLETLEITPADASRRLSPPQKRFNLLIRQIGKARETLAAWQQGTHTYAQAHRETLAPLRSELLAARKRWAFALDALLERKRWSAADQETMSESICQAAAEVLQADQSDAALKALFDKHSEVDFETEQQDALRAIKAMAKEMTGLDLGDDEGITSEDDLMARVHAAMEQEASAQAAHEAQAADRPRTAAQRRRDEAAAQATQEATQSVRAVYRKLASALHPDRETDAQQRTLKTALMQEVNQAYARNDLLRLLELQLQVEQVDAGHIASASGERLGHYNQVLVEQLEELRAEIDVAEVAFRFQFDVDPRQQVDPRKLGPLLKRELQALRAALAREALSLAMLGNLPATRRWLKFERLAQQDDDFRLDFS